MIESFLMTIAAMGIIVILIGSIYALIYKFGTKAFYIMFALILFAGLWAAIHSNIEARKSTEDIHDTRTNSIR